MTLGQYVGIGILLLVVVLFYMGFPKEPEENVEARRRYGRVGD